MLELRISIDRVNNTPVNEDDDDACLSPVSYIVAAALESLLYTARHAMTGDASLTQSVCMTFYGRTLSERPCYILPMFFSSFFFIPTLVGQTAERIFTKLSHVVDIRCYLRTY